MDIQPRIVPHSHFPSREMLDKLLVDLYLYNWRRTMEGHLDEKAAAR